MTCKVVLAGNFIFSVRNIHAKEIEIKQNAVYKMATSNLKKDRDEKLWQASSLGEENLSYKKPIAVGLDCKFMIDYQERFFYAASGVAQIKEVRV